MATSDFPPADRLNDNASGAVVGGLGNSPTGVFEKASKQERKKVKSRVTPRGNMKAARSVNHRGLPGGGGLW